MNLLTHDRIIEIAGTLTDAQISRILECAAEEEALLAAITWLNADDYMGQETLQEPSGKIATLCEILQSEEMPPEEPRNTR